MEEEKRFVDLLVAPDVYPTVKLLVRKEPGSDDEMSVNTISFHREMWRTLAKYCKQRVAHADISSSQELVISLNAIADAITREVSADEKRERNRDSYQSFADFVATINARTDLDTIRKAQMIHDRASELKLD
jgi:flagellar biosynthesis regulator FlaF